MSEDTQYRGLTLAEPAKIDTVTPSDFFRATPKSQGATDKALLFAKVSAMITSISDLAAVITSPDSPDKRLAILRRLVAMREACEMEPDEQLNQRLQEEESRWQGPPAGFMDPAMLQLVKPGEIDTVPIKQPAESVDINLSYSEARSYIRYRFNYEVGVAHTLPALVECKPDDDDGYAWP
jgi:hypothetical protein